MTANVRPRNQRRAQVASAARPAAAEAAQYLTFMLDQGVFAIGILAIKEIIEYAALTAIPLAPAWISGVINLRGTAVPVVDPAVRFGKSATRITKRTCIIIVEVALAGRRQDIGLIVDAVNAVLALAAGEIEAAPPFGASVSPDFIKGVGRVDGRFVIILDVDRVVASDALAALIEAAPAPGAPVEPLLATIPIDPPTAQASQGPIAKESSCSEI